MDLGLGYGFTSGRKLIQHAIDSTSLIFVVVPIQTCIYDSSDGHIWVIMRPLQHGSAVDEKTAWKLITHGREKRGHSYVVVEQFQKGLICPHPSLINYCFLRTVRVRNRSYNTSIYLLDSKLCNPATISQIQDLFFLCWKMQTLHVF